MVPLHTDQEACRNFPVLLNPQGQQWGDGRKTIKNPLEVCCVLFERHGKLFHGLFSAFAFEFEDQTGVQGLFWSGQRFFHQTITFSLADSINQCVAGHTNANCYTKITFQAATRIVEAA